MPRSSSATGSRRTRSPTSTASRATRRTTSRASRASATRRRRSSCSSSGRSRPSSTTSTTSRAPSASRTSPSTPATRGSARSSRRSSATSPSRSTRSPRPRGRSKLREVFREFELRTPLQRLEEAFGDDDAAAPAPVAEQTISARVRAGTLADVAALGVDAEVAVAVRAPAPPEGELFAETETWRFAVATGDRVLVGPCDGPEDVVAALGDREVIAHDAKALRLVPRNLVHDTLLAAYLLEPARRGFPFREICEERGLASDAADPAGADAVLVQ